MPFLPVLATRFASSFTIVEGSAVEITSTIAWPSLTVTLGNENSVEEPPTRSSVGVVNTTVAGLVSLLLPISNESIFVQAPLAPEGLRCRVRWVNRQRRF